MSTAAPLALPPPAGAARRGWPARIVRTPHLFVPATFLITVAGLLLDSAAHLRAQVLLGLCTWFFLAVALLYCTPQERAQTAVVVMVASCAEVIGSVIWGVYVYRLGNLPLFVPPGHGLVYLTGLRLSQAPWVRRRPRVLVRAAMIAVGAWALVGLTLLDRTDVAGAVGAVVLVFFLWRGRAPAVYAGVFFVVAFLELYGTWIGTWAWQAQVPGLGVADGNPPSGAASGYVFFDISALALAPSLLALAGKVRRWRDSPSPARSA